MKIITHNLDIELTATKHTILSVYGSQVIEVEFLATTDDGYGHKETYAGRLQREPLSGKLRQVIINDRIEDTTEYTLDPDTIAELIKDEDNY